MSVIDKIYFEINTFEILLAINSTKSELYYTRIEMCESLCQIIFNMEEFEM